MKTRKLRLYNTPPGAPKTPQIKYATAKNARNSIRRLAGKDKSYRKRLAMRMYYRAKFHKNQTPGMRDAMKVWKRYINSI
jgi:hypothetical protein